MIALVRQIRRHGLGSAALAYGVASFVLLGATWALAVEVVGMSPLYVRLLAVFALLGFPMVIGLVWAIREPADSTGKGHVVREE